MKNLTRGLGRNVILLGVVSLLTDVSSEMMLAVLPLFIASLGGAGIAVGLIGGIGDSVASLLNVFSGYWSDKMAKRKPFAFMGYLLSAVSKLFFPLVSSWSQLLILRPIERIGKGIRTAPRDALLATSTVTGYRGRAFGFHRAMDSLGAFLGTLLAFILFWHYGLGFRTILLIAALSGFVALFPFIRIAEARGHVEQPVPGSLRLGIANLPKAFKKYLVIAIIFSLGNFTYMFFILRAKEVFEPIFPGRMASAIPILLYCWFNAVYSVLSMPAGIFSDRFGRQLALRIGYLIFGISCLGFALIGGLLSFIIFFAAYGASFALVEGNQRAFAADFVGRDTRGSALGLFHTSVSASTLAAGLFAGLLWNMDPRLPFLYGSVLSFIAVFGIGRIPSVPPRRD